MDHPAGLTYLAVAYGGFFVLLAGFLLRIHRRGQDLQEQVDALQARTGGAAREEEA